MAGTGKSAISTTFSRNMDDEGLLGATFFIDRQVADRTDPRRIVQSLAYDLAERDSSRLRALWSSLRAKPTIKEMPLREQVQALIKRPLDATYSETLVIVIDGLDECAPSSGTQLLSTLVDCLAGLQIKLLVSSRRDHEIASRFALIPHKSILLQEQPLEEVENDVRLYWEHSLDELCPTRGDADSDWRHAISLDGLVERTGHLFIYATTILKMIENVQHSRVEELTELLEKSNPETSLTETNEGSLLDALYLHILTRAVSNRDGTVNPKSVLRLRNILEVVIFARQPLTRAALSQLLEMKTDALDGYIATLVSVLVIPDASSSDGVVRPLHQSFSGFVCQYSKRVHHGLAIEAATANARLTEHCLARLNKDLRFDICDIRDPSLFNVEVEDLKDRLRKHVSLALRYSCEFWAVHCLYYVRASRPQHQVPLGLVEFCNTHLLHWIELLSLINGLNDILRIMPTLLTMFEVSLASLSQCCERLMTFSSLQDQEYLESHHIGPGLADTYALMKVYMVPISSGALHVYHSGVVSMPRCTLSTQVSRPLVGKLVSQRDHQWPAGPMLFAGHPHGITSVAYSPNGVQIISGSEDYTVRVWEAVSGDNKHTLSGHTSLITSVAFSPDSLQIISSSDDRTVRVWDAASRAHKHTLSGHTGGIRSVVFSPDGLQIISGSDDCTVRVWDAVSGAHNRIMEGHTGPICSVAFSPNGAQIISGSTDRTVRVWDAVSGKHKHTMVTGHTDWICSVAFSPDGFQIISSSDDRTVRVWDATSRAHKHTLSGHTDWIRSVVFSPDGLQIISGSDDCTVRVWDAVSGAHRHTLVGHTRWIRSVAFSPDGSQIISGSYDRTVRVWDATMLGMPHNTLARDEESRCMAQGGATLSNKSRNALVTLNASTFVETHNDGHTDGIRSVVFSSDGLQIISGSIDRTVRVWDATSGVHKHTLEGHTNWIRSVAFSPNGAQIISGSDDRTVRVWDAVSGAHKHTLKGHTHWIRSVVFSPDGSQIISGSDDCTVRVWDAGSGSLQYVMEGFDPRNDTFSFLARSPQANGPY
jgi:WD40 repeat protein